MKGNKYTPLISLYIICAAQKLEKNCDVELMKWRLDNRTISDHQRKHKHTENLG